MQGDQECVSSYSNFTNEFWHSLSDINCVCCSHSNHRTNSTRSPRKQLTFVKLISPAQLKGEKANRQIEGRNLQVDDVERQGDRSTVSRLGRQKDKEKRKYASEHEVPEIHREKMNKWPPGSCRWQFFTLTHLKYVALSSPGEKRTCEWNIRASYSHASCWAAVFIILIMNLCWWKEN